MTPSPGRLALVANSQDFRTVAPDSATALILTLDALKVAVPPPDRLFGLFSENDAEWPEVLDTAHNFNAMGVEYNVRPIFGQDGPGAFPASVLAMMPKWGLPFKELYRYRGETLADAQQRWLYEAAALETAFPFDLGAVLQTYTMNGLYSLTDVEDIAAAGVEHLNARGPRWKAALTFAWDRKDGGQIPALAQLQSQIILSSPGWPAFHPVEHPIPPVQDDFMFFSHKGVRP